MTEVGTYDRFHLGETWKIYATLLDAAGAALPTLDEAVITEFRFGRAARYNGVLTPMIVLRSDEAFDDERGGIEKTGPGKVKVTVGAGVQNAQGLDTRTAYTYQFWVTLSDGERYCPVEGMLLLRPPV